VFCAYVGCYEGQIYHILMGFVLHRRYEGQIYHIFNEICPSSGFPFCTLSEPVTIKWIRAYNQPRSYCFGPSIVTANSFAAVRGQ
jgi:hypothetical protein